eukprot:COSAG05_NODE_1282_length_5283_cov_4.584684_5_plen_75_part_00
MRVHVRVRVWVSHLGLSSPSFRAPSGTRTYAPGRYFTVFSIGVALLYVYFPMFAAMLKWFALWAWNNPRLAVRA